MVEKTVKLPELGVKKIESKLSYNDKKIKKLRTFLEFNLKNVKSLQKNLNKLLEKKWYAPISEDGKAGGQTFEAIRIFENEYRGKKISDVQNLKNSDISDAMSWVDIELKRIKQEQNKKDKIQKDKFKETSKKASQHEVEKAQKELDQVDQDQHKETTKVVRATKKELKNHEKTILNNKLMETISIKNKKGELVPVKFAKGFKDKFDISSDKNNDIEFRSKDALIPFNFDIKVDTTPKTDSHGNEITGNVEYEYNFSLNLQDTKGVNFYEKKTTGKNNMNQIYYSFKKDGKVYLGVIGFKFDSDNGKITDFRVTEKVLERKKPFTKNELSNYESNVYDSGIFDSSGYIVENETIVNNVNHMDVGTDEKTYDKLKKKYSNEIALKGALQIIGAEIAINSTLRNNFPVGGIDKEGINTGDILGSVITLDGLEKSGLDKKLETLYKIIDKGTLTNAELRQVSKDMSKYPNLDKFTSKEKVKWLSDQNDSGKIGDMTDTIIGEKTVFELMRKLPDQQIEQKINEILTLAGCPENLKDTYFAKQYFYRGLERLNLSPVGLQNYLSGKMNLAEVEKHRIELQKKSKHDMLLYLLGSEEKVQEFEKKVKGKYEQLKKELENRLPEKYRNDPSIFERLKNGIEYTGISAAYIDHTRKQDTLGGAVNFSTDWGIIDNISLGVISKDGHIIPGLAVSKSFIKKFNDNRSSAGIGGMLVDGVIPLLSLSASHDFNAAGLEKWDSSSRKIVGTIGTAFPVLFGSLGYNFGRAGQIDYKEAKLNRVLDEMVSKLEKGEKLNEKDYSDKYEKELVRSINSVIKISKLDKLTSEERKEVYKTIESGIKQNFSRLLGEEDKGTRLSEIGLIWAVIPLVYAKIESIKVNYSLDKNASKEFVYSFDDIKNNEVKEDVKDINTLKNVLEKTLGENSVEIKDGRVFINLNNVKNGTLIAFGNGIQTKKIGNRVEIGGILTGEVLSSVVNLPGKHMNVIGLGQGAFEKGYSKDLSARAVMQNCLIKESNGKIDQSGFINESKNSKLIISQGKEKILNKEFIKAKEKFKTSELSKLLDKTMDGGIFVGKYKEKFAKQYEELVSLLRDYNYDKAINYISDVILAKRSPLSWYIYHKGGQKTLDKIRKDIKTIQDDGNLIQKEVFVEKFVSNLFLDENIKTKKGIPGAIQNKYIKNMSMNVFDNSDIGGDEDANRTAGFLRAVRNELLGSQNTLNGNLAIKGTKGVEKVEKEAKQILSNNKPEWFRKLDSKKQNHLIAFAHIVLAGENYISKKGFEKPTYKTVSVSDIIAFPFTYKKIVKNGHGHVPMYGTADLVDVNGDGKFDKNDYTEINSEQVNEYMYGMLSTKFKNSLKEIVKKTKGVDLTDEQLKELFVKKSLTINGKNINLSYKTIYTKWGECFNSTLALTDLQLDGAGLGVSAVRGNVYLNNQADIDVNINTIGLSARKYDDGGNNNGSNNGSNSGDPGGSTGGITKNPPKDNGGDAGGWN